MTLLALGDSYTIGEGVPLYDSFPYQAVQQLRKAGQSFTAPEILACTGWTTDELAAEMARTVFLPSYDFATLLIGVNNQYRGRDKEEFALQFEQLLQQVLRLSPRVFVLSIPDWGLTPFARTHLPDAKGRDGAAVSREIDTFNHRAEQISLRFGLPFIDITGPGRAAGPHPTLFAADGLHPSGRQYQQWAGLVGEKILACL